MNDLKTQSHIEEILNTIQQIACGQFSNRAPIYNEEDSLDAIAVGINMLGEEIEARIISQNKHSKELNDLANRFRAITSSAKDAIILMDQKKNVSYWNPAAEKMFGYSAEEMLSQSIECLNSPNGKKDE